MASTWGPPAGAGAGPVAAAAVAAAVGSGDNSSGTGLLLAQTTTEQAMGNNTLPTKETSLVGSLTILKYAPPILFPLGLLLNLILLCVPFLKQNRIVSCYAYIGGLALADLLFVLTTFGSWCSVLSHGSLPHGLCAASTYFYGVFEHTAILIIMAVTVDRAILVCFPISHFTFRSTRRALIVMVSLGTFSLIYNMPYFILRSAIFDTTCTVVLGGSPMWTFEWINFVIKLIIPVVFVLSIDILIAKKLHLIACRSIFKWNMKWSPEAVTTSAHSGTVGAMSSSRDDISIEDRKLSIMVVIMNFICLVCLTSPKYFHTMAYLHNIPYYTNPGEYYRQPGYEVTKFFILISACFKFIIYFCSNPQFRKAVREIFSILGSYIYLMYTRVRS